MAAVSVTELNQQTAKVLERVKGGESLEVKEHGRAIARIVPVLANLDVMDRLISEGRAIAASNHEALFAPVPTATNDSSALSDALSDARTAERS